MEAGVVRAEWLEPPNWNRTDGPRAAEVLGTVGTGSQRRRALSLASPVAQLSQLEYRRCKYPDQGLSTCTDGLLRPLPYT
jgi:hypothetical protein